jgi:hypothetical protein
MPAPPSKRGLPVDEDRGSAGAGDQRDRSGAPPRENAVSSTVRRTDDGTMPQGALPVAVMAGSARWDEMWGRCSWVEGVGANDTADEQHDEPGHTGTPDGSPAPVPASPPSTRRRSARSRPSPPVPTRWRSQRSPMRAGTGSAASGPPTPPRPVWLARSITSGGVRQCHRRPPTPESRLAAPRRAATAASWRPPESGSSPRPVPTGWPADPLIYRLLGQSSVGRGTAASPLSRTCRHDMRRGFDDL